MQFFVNEQPVEPAQCALLLMDFQHGILAPHDQAEKAVSNAAAAREVLSGIGVHIAHVRVAFEPADHDSIPSRNKVFGNVDPATFMPEGSGASRIVESLMPKPGEILVTKKRFSAFSTTSLHTHLRGRDVNTLILAGVSTGGVVLSTLREAADQDFGIAVLQDACADRQELHDLLMTEVFPRQAEVVQTDQLLASLAN